MNLWIIPLVFITIGWITYDPVSLPQTSVFLIFTSIALIAFKNRFWNKHKATWIALVMPASVILSAVINKQDFSSFILGGYQRNFGFALYIGLALLFLVISFGNHTAQTYIRKSLVPTLLIAIGYGILQVTDLDFFPWTNPFKSVTLTLGNPNFAAAFFGFMVLCLFYEFKNNDKKFIKIAVSIAILISIFLGYKTNSLQFYVVGIFSILTFAAVLFYKKLSHFRFTKILLTMVVGSAISMVTFFESFRKFLINEGNLLPRMDYWRTGLEIWKDYPITGVGFGNFQQYAAMYRSPSQEIRDGIFLIPDNAHNVLINHLATGGVIAGFAWIVFFVYVFKVIFDLSKLLDAKEKRVQLATLAGIWVGYTIQSMISTDQIVLTIIGYATAGYLVNMKVQAEKGVLPAPKGTSSLMVAQKTAGVLMLFFVLIFFSNKLMADRDVKLILEEKITQADKILEVVERQSSANAVELIGIKEFQKGNNCSVINPISDRMLLLDDRSSRAWYFKTICYNISGETQKSLNSISSALRYDPINLVYLFEKAKLEIIVGNTDSATELVSTIKKIDPNFPELGQIEAYLSKLS
jgi:O-antigen ligase